MVQVEWNDWVGTSAESGDVLTETPVRLMLATLDRAADAAAVRVLPALWHWLYFLPGERQSNIGLDGHPLRGGFLPPVTLPRRMWAGGRLQFLRPLHMGSEVRRLSRITGIQSKDGRSGRLVFVKVQHDISDGQGVAIREEQDIVYRGEPAANAPAAPVKQAPTDEQFSRQVVPDPVMLMRYSALTFNGHRIHYDRPYAIEQEGYPGLVVHGPFIATLLLDHLKQSLPNAEVELFEFKAVSPLFDTAPFTVAGKVEGRIATLWARGSQGQLAMMATAQLA
ncbi:FAS1-like dehydratase domain-containing protein [Polaromonas glacialis]|uniref:FAS1-like dehydratase domain-containing protein n=1 Tax=Polaromonas glacialis TaxID=866564 RepID=UPI0004960D2D|nr:MaoC family dehydratase N-terminal domain-containing protein [Polaromonas glacialis]